ncbi:MAG: hypothetical protein HY904_13715 [Deltaproteobacteria bacterium]|nr:hypothetical protein [Deltaproteobacteria bacterium]
MSLHRCVLGVLATLLSGSTALANTAPPDTATSEEVHRQRIRAEFLLLQDARTTTWGSDFGVEGRLLTLRIPLARWAYEEAPVAGFLRQRTRPVLQRLHLAGEGTAIRDAVINELPPFRLTVGGEGSTFNAEFGAVEHTLGHGALVQRYTNNPNGGFDMSRLGLVIGANAKAVGGNLMIANLLEPGKLVGFNVHGRPIQWFAGTYSNFQPEAASNFDMYSLLMSALTVGISGAVDTSAPSVVGQSVVNGSSLPQAIPGTVGGLSGEVDVGINHSVLAAHIYGNLTGLGRTFEEVTVGPDGRLGTGLTQASLFGAGATVGARFNIFLEVLKIGGALEYRLAGPNFTPSWFDRYYEGDRLYGLGGGPKITERSMGRHGYNLQIGAQLLKTLGVFWEMADLVQVDPRFGKNDGTMRLGGVLHLFGVLDFLGAYVNRGFNDYGRMFRGDASSMYLGEARLNLGPLNLVGRQWRTFEQQPTGGTRPRDGSSVMAELVIGLL